MKTETITTPNFTGSIANIIAEIQYQFCVNKIDTKVIEELLQDALSSARNSAYYDGFDDGYDVGWLR